MSWVTWEPKSTMRILSWVWVMAGSLRSTGAGQQRKFSSRSGLSHQHGHVEAVRSGFQGRHLESVRSRPHGVLQEAEACRVQDLIGWERGKAAMLFREGGERVVVLLRQDRACDVHDAAAGLRQGGRPVEDRGLLLAPHLKASWPQAPFGVRIAPPGADAGAGRVHQNAVDPAVEIQHRVGPGAGGADLDIAHPGPGEAVMDRGETSRVAVRGVE